MATYLEVAGSVLLECLFNAEKECGIHKIENSKFFAFYKENEQKLKESGCELEVIFEFGKISLVIKLDSKICFTGHVLY